MHSVSTATDLWRQKPVRTFDYIALAGLQHRIKKFSSVDFCFFFYLKQNNNKIQKLVLKVHANCTSNLRPLVRLQFRRKQWASCAPHTRCISSTDLCRIIYGKILHCHGEIAFLVPKNPALSTCVCIQRPLRACPHFNLWDTHRLCIVLEETRPQGSEHSRVPRPQHAAISWVHARLSCVTLAQGHQLCCGMREKAPFQAPDKRRPWRASMVVTSICHR